MAKKDPPPPRTFALQGDLDVFSIHGQWEALQTQLKGLGAGAKPVEVALELSGIGDVDLSGVQLLLALKRDLEAEGIRLRLSDAKTDWTTRFLPLGLAGLLDQETA
jgi:ABC-type transporter Mla MlaB component